MVVVVQLRTENAGQANVVVDFFPCAPQENGGGGVGMGFGPAVTRALPSSSPASTSPIQECRLAVCPPPICLPVNCVSPSD